MAHFTRRDLWSLASAASAVPSGGPGQPQSPGDPGFFPNVLLTTQDGARVRFYDDLVKDRVVLINFMFTTCASLCPRATENLMKVAEGLGDRLGRDVRIISLTVDPDRDTPDVLKQYAAKFRTPPGWYFVTGREKDITQVRVRLGVNRDGNEKMDHTGLVVYGNDRTAQWGMTPSVASPRTILWSLKGLLETTP
jgi:protein SCO1/2